jgi:hypothetical protein
MHHWGGAVAGEATDLTPLQQQEDGRSARANQALLVDLDLALRLYRLEDLT